MSSTKTGTGPDQQNSQAVEESEQETPVSEDENIEEPDE